MNWNWLYSLIYGAISGISEFLPVSSDAQRLLLFKIAGLSDPGPSMLLAVHLGCLLALLLTNYGKLAKLFRERKLASIPPRRRRRQPDAVSLIEFRLIKIAAVPLVLSCVATYWLYGKVNNLLVLSLFLCLNGALILFPEHMQRSNKDARSLSPFDALLTGLGGALGIVPGISRIGTFSSFASIRGADQQYALRFAYLLLIPAFAVLCAVDVALLIAGVGDPMGGSMILNLFLTFCASVTTAGAGIYLMRFLSVKIGYSGFAYYSFGLGIFTLILYLIG